MDEQVVAPVESTTTAPVTSLQRTVDEYANEAWGKPQEDSATSTQDSEPEPTANETKPKGNFKDKSDTAARFEQLLSDNKALNERLAALETPKPQEKVAEQAVKLVRPTLPEALPKYATFEGTVGEWHDLQDARELAMVKYNEELADFKAAEKLEQWAQSQQAKIDEEKSVGKIKAQIADLEKGFPDFTKVVMDANIPVSPAMDQYVKQRGLAVLYHLSKNPEEAKRIFDLEGISALVELDSFEKTKTAESHNQNQTKARIPSPPAAEIPRGGRSYSPDEWADTGFEAVYAKSKNALHQGR